MNTFQQEKTRAALYDGALFHLDHSDRRDGWIAQVCSAARAEIDRTLANIQPEHQPVERFTTRITLSFLFASYLLMTGKLDAKRVELLKMASTVLADGVLSLRRQGHRVKLDSITPAMVWFTFYGVTAQEAQSVAGHIQGSIEDARQKVEA